MTTKATDQSRNLFGFIPRRWRLSLLALLIFSTLATLLLNKALLPDYTLLPLDIIQHIAPWDDLELGRLANPLISDPFYSFFPRRFILTSELAKGHIPLWNPYILSGTPAFANPNFQPFYPPNLITALRLPAQHALPWLAWGHLILTGWLMYLFLRQHKLRWLAAVLGAGVWMLNSYLVVWLENPHRLSTLAWVPGIFWAYQKALDDDRLDVAAIGGLMLGFSILGGQMQFIFGSGLVLGVYALGQLAWTVREGRRLSLKPLLPLLIIGVIGLGVGAITLLPAGEFAAFSQRSRITAETVTLTRFPWEHLVTLIAPDFYGNPVNPGGYWGQLPNYAELAVYFGLVALLLALTAPFVARRRGFSFTALLTTLFIVAIILGTPLVRILYLFPGAQFVVLTRLLFLLPLGGAWLAAIGLDGWLTTSKPPRWLLAPIGLFLVAFTLVTLKTQDITLESHPETYIELTRSAIILLVTILLLLYLPRHSSLIGGILVFIALVELLQVVWDFNPVTSTTYLYPENEVVDTLRQDPSLFRVLPLQSEKIIFGPNVLSVYGIQEVGGYTPLIKADYARLYKRIGELVDFGWLRSSPNKLAMSDFDPTASLLNIKYVLSNKELRADEILQVDHTGCDGALPLQSDSWLTRTFTATQPGLNRIDILQAPTAAAGKGGIIEFRLWRELIDGDLVALSELAPSTDDDPTTHTVYFAPVADSAGQSFVIGLSGDEGASFCSVSPDRELAFAAFGTQLILRDEADNVLIYENPNALPRAYLVHHAEVADDGNELDLLFNPDFDYYHDAVLSNTLPDEQQRLLADIPIRPQGHVQVTGYSAHRVDLDVALDQPGILVLLDSNYPGWQAMVDESKQPLFNVNGVFRGIFLMEGSHSVSFQFRPLSLTIGLVIAALSITLAVLIITFSYRHRKSSRSKSANPA